MKGIVAVVIVFVIMSPAFADKQVIPIAGVTAIANGTGAARILFKTPVMDLANVAISQATLRVSVVGPLSDRRMSLRIHPVTTPWEPGGVSWTAGWARAGGDFDDDLYAWSELDLDGGGELTFDMTRVAKEIVEEGVYADGFLLTVDPADGIGLLSDDVERFQGLASASVEIAYRNVHPHRRNMAR